jgi:CheY-like chemotaxis protein
VPHTLLLADDSVTTQRLIELTFADQDISVVAFSDGDHAIASLSRTPPDIVLADIGMPGRSGYDVARYIKQTPELSHIPVLLVTGAFEPVDQERVREIGCDGVLTKPFEPQLVISRVKELLTKAGHGNGDSHLAGRKLDKAAEIENYFEQLDQAFASLAGAPSMAPLAPEPLPVPPVSSAAPLSFTPPVPPPPARHDVHADTPLGAPGLADAFAALLTAEDSGGSQVAALSALAAPPPDSSVSLDEIVDQVTARVLARLSDGMLHDAAANVIAPTAERTVHAAITDIVTPIAERVVRSAIADVVSTTAERLVREEIDRIKSNIK